MSEVATPRDDRQAEIERRQLEIKRQLASPSSSSAATAPPLAPQVKQRRPPDLRLTRADGCRSSWPPAKHRAVTQFAPVARSRTPIRAYMPTTSGTGQKGMSSLGAGSAAGSFCLATSGARSSLS
jgi:hypothetical protein